MADYGFTDTKAMYQRAIRISIKIHLTALCATGGCGAKIPADTLETMVQGLPAIWDDNLLVGFEGSDDAGVYKLSSSMAIIQTLDFFPPIVDDPYLYGKIAAANA